MSRGLSVNHGDPELTLRLAGKDALDVARIFSCRETALRNPTGSAPSTAAHPALQAIQTARVNSGQDKT